MRPVYCIVPFRMHHRRDGDQSRNRASFQEIVEVFDKAHYELEDPSELFGPRDTEAPEPEAIPDQWLPFSHDEPLVLKGTYASAVGAIMAGCRHV